jgi:hypothetical protein
MTMLERLVKERNDALFSLDRKKIEAYLKKYVEMDTAKTPDETFWAAVYQAICGIKEAPHELVAMAHTWLSANGIPIPA